MEKTIVLSKEFVQCAQEQGVLDINVFVKKLFHRWIPVQAISDAMKGTTQVSFNYDPDCGIFELVDPFGLSGIETKKYNNVK